MKLKKSFYQWFKYGNGFTGWPPENMKNSLKNMRIHLKYNETRIKTKKVK